MFIDIKEVKPGVYEVGKEPVVRRKPKAPRLIQGGSGKIEPWKRRKVKKRDVLYQTLKRTREAARNGHKGRN